MSSLKLTNILV